MNSAAYATEPMTDEDALYSNEDSLAEAFAVGSYDQEGLGYTESDPEAYDEMVHEDMAGLQ